MSNPLESLLAPESSAPDIRSEKTTSEFLSVISHAEEEIDDLTTTLRSLQSFRAGSSDPANRASYQGARARLAQLHDRLDDLYAELGRIIADDTKNADDRMHAKQALEGSRDLFRNVAEKLKAAEQEFHELPEQGLAAAMAMHRKVKARYASAVHVLSDDQRREFRSHIAHLAGLVREAEDAEHRQLFPPCPPNAHRTQKHVPHITLTIARAHRSAEVLTDALAAAVKAR